MFRTNSPSPQFHATIVSALTQHDHFGLYITASDTRAQALTNAVDHLLRQAECTGARLGTRSLALVASIGRPGAAAQISKCTNARVVAVCSSDSVAVNKYSDSLKVVHADFPDAAFTQDDASFDVVMSVDALAAAHDKHGMIADAFRVLKEGGLLVGMDVVARPAAQRTDLARFEKDMAVPPLITLYAYEKLLREVGFMLMRTCDLSAHVIKSYRQIIARARTMRETIDDCDPADIDHIVTQLEDDVRGMIQDDTIGWTTFVALKPYADERDGKLVVE